MRVQQVKAVSEAEKRLEKSKKEIESKNKPLVEVVEKIKRAEVRRRYGLCSCDGANGVQPVYRLLSGRCGHSQSWKSGQATVANGSR